MATRSGRKPGRPPNPKFNLTRNGPATQAISRLLDEAFSSADKAEDLIASELGRPDLGPADRLLALTQMVTIVKFRTTMACEVVATFGKRRADEILPEPDRGPSGDGPSGSPFSPGEQILPTVTPPDQEPP